MQIDYSPLWHLLVDRKITASKLSEDTGISKATFSRMKKGQDITVSKVLRISSALNCSADQIVKF